MSIMSILFFLFIFQTQDQKMEQAEESNEVDDNLGHPDSEASEKLKEGTGDV